MIKSYSAGEHMSDKSKRWLQVLTTKALLFYDGKGLVVSTMESQSG